jgi:hypothetical protein
MSQISEGFQSEVNLVPGHVPHTNYCFRLFSGRRQYRRISNKSQRQHTVVGNLCLHHEVEFLKKFEARLSAEMVRRYRFFMKKNFDLACIAMLFLRHSSVARPTRVAVIACRFSTALNIMNERLSFGQTSRS